MQCPSTHLSHPPTPSRAPDRDVIRPFVLLPSPRQSRKSLPENRLQVHRPALTQTDLTHTQRDNSCSLAWAEGQHPGYTPGHYRLSVLHHVTVLRDKNVTATDDTW